MLAYSSYFFSLVYYFPCRLTFCFLQWFFSFVFCYFSVINLRFGGYIPIFNCKKWLTPLKKFATPPEKISAPPEKISTNTSRKNLNHSRENLNPSRKNLNPSRKNLNPSRKNLNPLKLLKPTEYSPTLLKNKFSTLAHINKINFLNPLP